MSGTKRGPSVLQADGHQQVWAQEPMRVQNEDQCQGRKEETPVPCRIRPTVRKKGGGNRFGRQSQNTDQSVETEALSVRFPDGKDVGGPADLSTLNSNTQRSEHTGGKQKGGRKEGVRTAGDAQESSKLSPSRDGTGTEASGHWVPQDLAVDGSGEVLGGGTARRAGAAASSRHGHQRHAEN